jgi:pimeloyl-ACP methyl ester carboxylesterase
VSGAGVEWPEAASTMNRSDIRRSVSARDRSGTKRDSWKYVGRFDAIADYLARRQPPSLMVWGRHDPFFELAEVLSWMQALPRMEAHVLDAGHKLLETHAAAAVSLMLDFIRRTQREGERIGQHRP